MIGPSFQYELVAAGVTDWRFSWGSDGVIQFHNEVAQSERDKVNDVLAAHDPDTPAPSPAAGAEAMLSRQRSQAVEDLERRMNLGAPQGEINAALLNLLKERTSG